MKVSSMGVSKSTRMPSQPRDQFEHLQAGGGEITEQSLHRREPGSKVQQVLHRAYHKAPLCMRLQLGFEQLNRPRPCVVRTSHKGKQPQVESSSKEAHSMLDRPA